jgi:hypothetical protein
VVSGTEGKGSLGAVGYLQQLLRLSTAVMPLHDVFRESAETAVVEVVAVSAVSASFHEDVRGRRGAYSPKLEQLEMGRWYMLAWGWRRPPAGFMFVLATGVFAQRHGATVRAS